MQFRYALQSTLIQHSRSICYAFSTLKDVSKVRVVLHSLLSALCRLVR